MSSLLEYLGKTMFFSPETQTWKTWHIWGYYEPTGELTAIRYGISTDLLCAHPDFHHRERTTALHFHLWVAAQELLHKYLMFDEEEDIELIEPSEDNVIPFSRRQ